VGCAQSGAIIAVEVFVKPIELGISCGIEGAIRCAKRGRGTIGGAAQSGFVDGTERVGQRDPAADVGELAQGSLYG